MKIRQFFTGTFLILFCTLSLSHCGGSGGGITFTIQPGGPTVVIRGETLQFTTNPTGLGVTWSVV